MGRYSGRGGRVHYHLQAWEEMAIPERERYMEKATIQDPDLQWDYSQLVQIYQEGARVTLFPPSSNFLLMHLLIRPEGKGAHRCSRTGKTS